MIGQTSVDGELLYSTLGNDLDLGEMVDLFVEEMPRRVAEFVDLFDRQDWAELRRAAHQLKGAAGSYGFKPISPCAARLEQDIDEGLPLDQIRQDVEEIRDLCTRARSGAPR